MARTTKEKNARESVKSESAEKRKPQIKKTKASKGKGTKHTPAAERSKATKGCSQTTKKTASTSQRSPTSRSTPGANAQSQQAAPKKPPRRKNVSQITPNGTLIITNDKCFYGTDGKSDKKRMAVTVDSNRNDELAIVKYTTSQKHGRPFDNSKGFVGHGDKIYTLDNDKKPIKADGKKFIAQGKREITTAQANEIKRRNVKESKYKAGNRKNLQNLKKRKK